MTAYFIKFLIYLYTYITWARRSAIAPRVQGSITRNDRTVSKSTVQKTNAEVELSDMTFDDLMAFIGADEAVMA